MGIFGGVVLSAQSELYFLFANVAQYIFYDVIILLFHIRLLKKSACF